MKPMKFPVDGYISPNGKGYTWLFGAELVKSIHGGIHLIIPVSSTTASMLSTVLESSLGKPLSNFAGSWRTTY